MIRRKAAAAGAKRIVCTPKDAVKLTKLGCEDFYVIDLEVNLEKPYSLTIQKMLPSISGGINKD